MRSSLEAKISIPGTYNVHYILHVHVHYTRTIAGKIFNNRRAVEELDMNNGTAGMECRCNSSPYKYEPCGHVVTGDLNIIEDIKLRNLIRKGPSCREQNNIDWKVNVKNCKEAVSRYTKKWATRADVDE